jgi:hypothetical protein
MVRVKVLGPIGGGISAGLKLAVEPDGAPDTDRTIGLLRAAPVGATAKLNVAALPATVVTLAGADAVRVKSAAAGLPIVTINGGEVDGSSTVLPEYAAVSVCEPVLSRPVAKVAAPPARGAEASGLVPSISVALPLGTPAAALTATESVAGVSCVKAVVVELRAGEIAPLPAIV